jgi:hypothetical protein
MADSPLLRIADKWVGRYKTLVQKALTSGQRAVSISRIRAAVDAKNTVAVEQATAAGLNEIDMILRENMPAMVLNLLAAAGNVAGRELLPLPLTSLKAVTKARISKPLRFDKKNPEAIRWAERHAARLITEIGEEARQAVRHVVVAGLSEGIAPVMQAQMIRASVGLTERYATAVVNFERRLRESPGRLVRAGNLTFRVPQSGMTAQARNQAVAKYADRLTRSRALNIARTETITASNEGQQQLWRQARAKGLLDADVRREWIASGKACEICAGLDGKNARLEESFSGSIFSPPAHPSCRCTVGLIYV